MWWTAADEAYGASENIITPWPGRNLDMFKDAFNFFLSGGNRNVIERAFGLLTKRWGILARALSVCLERAPLVVITCAALQNFLINQKEEFTHPSSDYATDEAPEKHDEHPSEMHAQDECVTEPRPLARRDREKSMARFRMTTRLRELGQIRPSIIRSRP